MTQPPEDPFLSTPSPDAAEAPAAAAPEAPAEPAAPAAPAPEPAAPPAPAAAPAQPGIIPGSAPPAPAAPGVFAAGAATAPPPAPAYTPDKPTGIAWGAIVATGLYTLLAAWGVFTVADTVDELKVTLSDTSSSPSPFGNALTGLLSFVIGITSFVLLALWMSKIRSNLAAQGVKAGGPPAVEWWGWFVPIANYVLPLLGMRSITRKSVGWLLLAGWWIPFALYWAVSFIAQGSVYAAIDLGTGELTNPDALDIMVPLTWLGGVLLGLSWLFLVLIILRTTDRHQKA